jgi:hypothetical protein
MDDHLTRTDLLASMMAERGLWDELLDEVGEHRMDEPDAVGRWPVKLVVAHVMGWERWAAEQVRAAARGEPPTTRESGPEVFDAMNEEFIAPYVEMAPGDVRAVSDDIFGNLLGSVELLAPEQLDIRGYARWSPNQTIGELVAESSFRHYPEHMEQIRAWLE